MRADVKYLIQPIYIQLEKKAAKYVLDNIKSSFSAKNGLISRLATFEEDSGLPLDLANFVDYYHLDVRTIFSRANFARLCVSAGVREEFEEELEEIINKALKRICAIDSRRWIAFLLDILPRRREVSFFQPSEKVFRRPQRYGNLLDSRQHLPFEPLDVFIIVW